MAVLYRPNLTYSNVTTHQAEYQGPWASCWGIPSRRDPLWVCRLTFFFFFSSAAMFCAHLLWRKQRIGLKFCITILMDMLQVEVKNIFGALIFHWVMWVKLLKKTFVTHNTEMKSPIGLIFCRNMLMDSLQGIVIYGFWNIVRLWVIWLIFVISLFE